MVTIIFESHCTSLDNENHLSSGHYDAELSPLGEQQAKELGERYRQDHFDAIFCSDLQRSFKTAELAFADRDFPIVKDARLRECDYGDWTRKSSSEVERERANRVDQPFPNGESYTQTSERVKSFLTELLKEHNGKQVMIIGHRATQFGLERWINGVPLMKAITSPWKWQPGWSYSLERI